ncbi:MAG TPA: MupA/Atu3671 family FMN-dependent luciferase-like monooxygenase, partial [Polyangiales bacterium]|nr:MupA/Atu3671 family FMN-dependent luciferase-like monooxygenase [Polyangiales bacterium]
EERALLASWNDTGRPLPEERATIHGAFEAQCARTPECTAVIFEGRELSYAQLNTLAERLAARLCAEGVTRDSLVGVFVERGLSLLIATLGIWKAGGAYLPLDPGYPAERLRFMREDSGARLIVSEAALAEQWPTDVKVIDVVQSSGEGSPPDSRGSDLAYVIYTSGSTGKPKGVMVEHRQVLNFFAGMDEVVPHDQPNPVWLSVTSLSFDISVLELFWTLARGFTLVIYRDRARDLAEPISRTMPALRARGWRALDFSLFLWGAQDTRSDQTYRLMLEAARFGDRHGFAAIWTPERHFHAFGGPYPNPSVTGAALAAITQRLQIRAGSCVVPLHHPARVSEEWAVVDNLSNGRVGISFASGWQPDDFLLRPESYRENKRVMLEQIEQVRRLWRGEELSFPGPLGNPVQVRTQPRPIQAELPFWLTAAGSPDTFVLAGKLGANLLTHLLGQSLDELTDKIASYRRARAAAGFDPDTGVVTLMLHTFIGSSVAEVRALVREPMKQYLKSSVHLIKNFAWAFPAFKRPAGQGAAPDAIDIAGLSAEELDAVLEFAFERYFETSGLFGTPESCLPMLERLQAIGVDDVACLIDFGVPTEQVLAGLEQLDELRARAARPVPQPIAADGDALSLAEQIARYHVTHLQCTPSLLRLARGDDAGRAAIDGVPHLFVGGEAFPADLAVELAGHAGSVTNMYGPTETTVWSATHRLSGVREDVPLGRPIANTRLHVLDAQQRPLPIGVPGELYIAGAGVVRGYHGRPELTDERFVPDPFAADGGRMYRTGDLVRWSASGVLEFLGRLDQQVKVRGHRIELGEIEALLLRQPGVREAAVIARGDTLVAYFSGEAGEARLREAARASLPEFMLPGAFVQLPELPHTPNGKLDRKALPAPEALVAPKRAFTAPENELEGKVAALWCQVLGVSQVGVQDNFFDIGGHSLLVVKLHRLLRAELAPELALTDVYRFPTVRALVGQIAGGGDNAAVEQAQDRAALRLERLSARRDLAQRRRPR